MTLFNSRIWRQIFSFNDRHYAVIIFDVVNLERSIFYHFIIFLIIAQWDIHFRLQVRDDKSPIMGFWKRMSGNQNTNYVYHIIS